MSISEFRWIKTLLINGANFSPVKGYWMQNFNVEIFVLLVSDWLIYILQYFTCKE